MDRKNNRAYLLDMLDNARFVQGFVRDKSEANLTADTATRFAVERELQNIGEAAYQLRRIEQGLLTGVTESDRIIGMRHVLVHGYDEVKVSVLWDVATKKLGTLIRELEALLADPESSTS